MTFLGVYCLFGFSLDCWVVSGLRVLVGGVLLYVIWLLVCCFVFDLGLSYCCFLGICMWCDFGWGLCLLLAWLVSCV